MAPADGSRARRAPRADLEAAARLLPRAGSLVATRSSWTKHALARDRHGHRVLIESDRAVRFCAGGALLRARHESRGRVVRSPAVLGLAYELLSEALADALSTAETALLLAVLLQRRDTRTVSALSSADQRWEFIVEANDLPGVSHRLIVAAFGAAIREARAQARRG